MSYKPNREVYRTIPEFPKYEITMHGDVRNRRTWVTLNESQNPNTLAWAYSLRRADGTSTQRHYEKLLFSAWPEMDYRAPAKVRENRSYSTRGQWETIPDFPRYQLHPDGFVRYAKSKKRRSTFLKDGVDFVTLYVDRKPHHVTIEHLKQLVFADNLVVS